MIHFDRPVNYKRLKLIENVNAVFCNFEIEMPTILLIAGWRLYFWANEKNEPIHIHAEKGDMECKFWLDIENFEIMTALEYNLTPQARREIKKIIYEHFDYIVAEWSKFFKD
jgi:hypothetical protein